MREPTNSLPPTGPMHGPGSIIGELRLVHRNARVTATLGEDLCWRCDNAEVATMLHRASGVEALIAARKDLDLASLRRLGRHAMYRAASRVRGRVTLPTAPAEREPQLAGL